MTAIPAGAVPGPAKDGSAAAAVRDDGKGSDGGGATPSTDRRPRRNGCGADGDGDGADGVEGGGRRDG